MYTHEAIDDFLDVLDQHIENVINDKANESHSGDFGSWNSKQVLRNKLRIMFGLKPDIEE